RTGQRPTDNDQRPTTNDQRRTTSDQRPSEEESMRHELTLAFVGAGGDGAVAAGDIIANACAAEGLNVMKTEAYGPQIRGGESSSVVRLSTTPLFASSDAIDALVI